MSRGQGQAMEPRAITLTIDSRLENLGPLGIATRAASRELGLDDRDASRVELCVVELAANSIRHAYRGEAGRPVTVQLVAQTRGLLVAVIDEGTPVPVERRAAPPAPQDPVDVQSIAEGGRGLFLVHQLMDTVSYESEGARNVVRLTKAFSTSSG
jgi:serine/threonine-protein kinase RsbW